MDMRLCMVVRNWYKTGTKLVRFPANMTRESSEIDTPSEWNDEPIISLESHLLQLRPILSLLRACTGGLARIWLRRASVREIRIMGGESLSSEVLRSTS